MYLESAMDVSTGDLITATFELPTGEPCKLRATVVRRDDHGCGVQFGQVHPRSLINLKRYWALSG
jgi:hypothetical protein